MFSLAILGKYTSEPQWYTNSYGNIVIHMAIIKKIISGVDMDVEKLKLSYTAGENVKWCSSFENTLAVSEKVKHWLYYPEILPLGIYSRELKIHVYTEIVSEWMFIAALLIMTKMVETIKYLSTDERANKTWYIYAMQDYSAIRRPGVLIVATTWINLEKTTLSERS